MDDREMEEFREEWRRGEGGSTYFFGIYLLCFKCCLSSEEPIEPFDQKEERFDWPLMMADLSSSRLRTSFLRNLLPHLLFSHPSQFV